jgi:hypothetical protein
MRRPGMGWRSCRAAIPVRSRTGRRVWCRAAAVSPSRSMTEVIPVRVRPDSRNDSRPERSGESKDSAAKVTVSDLISEAVEGYLKRHGG